MDSKLYLRILFLCLSCHQCQSTLSISNTTSEPPGSTVSSETPSTAFLEELPTASEKLKSLTSSSEPDMTSFHVTNLVTATTSLSPGFARGSTRTTPSLTSVPTSTTSNGAASQQTASERMTLPVVTSVRDSEGVTSARDSEGVTSARDSEGMTSVRDRESVTSVLDDTTRGTVTVVPASERMTLSVVTTVRGSEGVTSARDSEGVTSALDRESVTSVLDGTTRGIVIVVPVTTTTAVAPSKANESETFVPVSSTRTDQSQFHVTTATESVTHVPVTHVPVTHVIVTYVPVTVTPSASSSIPSITTTTPRLYSVTLGSKSSSVTTMSVSISASVTLSTAFVTSTQVLSPPTATPTTPKPLSKPKIHNNLTSIDIIEGEQLVLKCNVTGNPQPSITWFKNRIPLLNGMRNLNSSFTIAKTLRADTGKYSCRAENSEGLAVMEVTVNIIYAPTIHNKLTSINIIEGEQLVLKCNATGNPQPSITWLKDITPLPNAMRNLDDSFTIATTSRADKGKYVCRAENIVDLTRMVVTVNIIYLSDISMTITGNRRVVVEGSNVTLTCSVKANPRGIIRFKRNNGSVFDGIYQKGNTASLDLKTVTRENGGNYTCSADNNHLFAVTYIVLHVYLSEEPTYPPPKKLHKTPNAITIPIHNIAYLSNGKPVRYVMVIVLEVKDGTVPGKQPSTYQPRDLGPYDGNRTRPYIAAVLTTPFEDKFTLGDNQKYSIPRVRRNAEDQITYRNVPLRPNTYYTAFQRTISQDGDHESLEWIAPTKTLNEVNIEEGSSSSLSLILGILLAFLVVLILIVIIVHLYKKRQSQAIGVDKYDTGSGLNPLGKMARTFSIHMARLHENYQPSGPIKVEEFPRHVTRMHKSGDMYFSTEYERIVEYSDIPATHSIDSANQWKNRYTNIIAYDYNRVKLIPFDDEPASDYINASYINGYDKGKTYIAAQGPLDETCGDFWRMVWEQNTRVIVMLTNVRERGRVKCSQYWPTSGTAKYESFQVSLVKTIEITSYTIRIFHVVITGQTERRVIKQYHFTSWPDHGVPKTVTFLLAFVRETVKVNPTDAGPMVVHCSAGVGRTGTFIVIDAMLQQIEREKTVDILNYVNQLRKQRNLMVQTEQQYIFIHDALLDVIFSGDTEIPARKLRDYVEETSQINKETGETKMSKEFQRLTRSVRSRLPNTAATISKRKNRYANALPYDDTRVRLVVRAGESGSDYINASYIDAYQTKRAFIATQAPLHDTFVDFWRMVWEQECYTIVTLAQEIENTKAKMNRFWPTSISITFGDLQVEMVEEEKKEYMDVRVFNVINTKEDTSREVRQFHYTDWAAEDLSDSGSTLLNLIEDIEEWQAASGRHVITVHCSAGVGRTGVFCAVSSLIERLKSEAVVDVFQTVKQLREQRPAMVQTKSQYEYCYQAVLEYLGTHPYLVESSKATTDKLLSNALQQTNSLSNVNNQKQLDSSHYNMQNGDLPSEGNCIIKLDASPKHTLTEPDASEGTKADDTSNHTSAEPDASKGAKTDASPNHTSAEPDAKTDDLPNHTSVEPDAKTDDLPNHTSAEPDASEGAKADASPNHTSDDVLSTGDDPLSQV